MSVTVYSQPRCSQCDATYRVLDKKGIEYTTVNVAEDPEAHAYVKSLGYMAAPVVVAGDTHWSGYRPDKLSELATILARA
jgi:glutaredoxin-like protein NrdH